MNFRLNEALDGQSEVLWGLALACKECEPIMFDEWLQTLESIEEKNDYYSKAQRELLFYVVNRSLFSS